MLADADPVDVSQKIKYMTVVLHVYRYMEIQKQALLTQTMTPYFLFYVLNATSKITTVHFDFDMQIRAQIQCITYYVLLVCRSSISISKVSLVCCMYVWL